MAKLFTMFLILIALQACLILYTNSGHFQYDSTGGVVSCTHLYQQGGNLGSGMDCIKDYTCQNSSIDEGATYGLYCLQYGEGTSLWNFVFNLDRWNILDFLMVSGVIAAGLLLSGIASGGGTFRFVTDFIIIAPAIAGLASIGIIFTNFANLIRSELVARFFTSCPSGAGSICPPAVFIVGVIVGPIAFYYVWTVISWWRGQES